MHAPSFGPPLEPLPEDFSSVLCVVAHPDDIEYGTAAAVARWTEAGRTVTYFLLTRGEAGIDTMAPAEAGPVREAEERASAAVVGVTEVDFGDHRDGTVEYGLDLGVTSPARSGDAGPTSCSPGLRLPFRAGILNQAATVRCVWPRSTRSPRRQPLDLPELVDDGFEPWNVAVLAFAGSSRPTHYVDVSDRLAVAVESLEAHEAYNSALPDEFPKPDQLVPMILEMGATAAQADGVTHALTLDVVVRR